MGNDSKLSSQKRLIDCLINIAHFARKLTKYNGITKKRTTHGSQYTLDFDTKIASTETLTYFTPLMTVGGKTKFKKYSILVSISWFYSFYMQNLR